MAFTIKWLFFFCIKIDLQFAYAIKTYHHTMGKMRTIQKQ